MKAVKKIISRFHKKVKIVLFYTQRLTFSKTNEKKTIVVCFDGTFSHGGLVDRIKGMISFYEVAKQLNCDFKIRFDHPFDLTVYFKPNQHDWNLNKKLKYNPLDTQVFYLMDDFHCNPLDLVSQSKAKTLLIYCNMDYLKKIIPNCSEEQHAMQWRTNFNELFTKSPFLKKELTLLPDEKCLVFHTRFTSLMGDFKDTTVAVLSEKEKEALKQVLVALIYKKAVLYPDYAVYVLSDSTLFLDYVSCNTNYKVLSGVPKHVDIKKNEADLTSHTKTLTDFFFIAGADRVYLLKEGKMYNSGFSKYAAILGDTPFEVLTS